MVIANSDFSKKIERAYAMLKMVSYTNAPHEFLAIYYPTEGNAESRASITEKVSSLFPEFDFLIVDITSSPEGESKLALIHPKAHLMLEQLIASGVAAVFDPDHMALYGFSPKFMRQNDLFEFLKVLREELDCPMWNS
ncbi:hypothetical protein ACO0KY_13070 [Undibacterium sp. Dicai25W]|uniref:hypothetical protein n=1 Tax=Undibacterium sp. Dicai25W TaxID=3413034 RepID=UPI003BF34AB6